MRTGSREEADTAAAIADGLGVAFVLHEARLERGPNLESAARSARRALLPDDVATGHTLDDQAETVLVNLLRGAGSAGLAAIAPSTAKPLLALRRRETTALCDAAGIAVVVDPTNRDPAHLRNRIRHELLPLCSEIAGRDVAPLLARTASLCRDDDDLLRRLSSSIDATDAVAVANEPVALARRALRDWLSVDGYPPPLAAIDRVVEVANGTRVACELPGGDRVARSSQRLRRIAQGGE